MIKLKRELLPMVIKVDNGKVTKKIRPANGRDFKCEELQAVVDGYFEIVYLHGLNEGLLMVVNEEGKFSKDDNDLATLIALSSKAIYPNDYIAGDVLICPSDMIR